MSFFFKLLFWIVVVYLIFVVSCRFLDRLRDVVSSPSIQAFQGIPRRNHGVSQRSSIQVTGCLVLAASLQSWYLQSFFSHEKLHRTSSWERLDCRKGDDTERIRVEELPIHTCRQPTREIFQETHISIPNPSWTTVSPSWLAGMRL